VIKVTCMKGKTLDTTYFVATDKAGNKAAVRATRVVDPKFHKLANEDTDDAKPKVEVQPNQLIAKFEKLCPDLESFKKLAYSMALENEGVGVTAAKEGDAPEMATENLEKVKVDAEPTVAAEEGLVADANKTESAPAVRKFYGRLPGKVTGSPEVALDLQSKLKATEEALGKVTAEKDELQKENEGMKKAGGAEKVIKILEALGLIEYPKHKDAYTKKLTGMPEQAMGVLESILKDIEGAEKGEKGGEAKPKAPAGLKPPFGGGAPGGKKPEGAEPPLDSRANIIQATYEEVGVGGGSIAELWAKADRMKELSA